MKLEDEEKKWKAKTGKQRDKYLSFTAKLESIWRLERRRSKKRETVIERTDE